VAGHEGSSGEIKVRVMTSNLWVRNQEAVVLVKKSLNYMALHLCSVASFQALWSLSPKSDFCIQTSHSGFWHPQYCRAVQSFRPI